MKSEPKKLVVLTPNSHAPSLRYRIENAFSELEHHGWKISVIEFKSKKQLPRLRENKQSLKNADVVFIAKAKLGFWAAWYLRRLAKKIVYDFDDAIYFRRPRTIQDRIGRSWPRQLRFLNACRIADLVIPGNEVLAKRAASVAKRIEILPTAIDVDRYPELDIRTKRAPVAVWVGLPNNLAYLELIRPAFVEISNRFPDFRLRIVSSKKPDWNDVPIEFVPWSPESEVSALQTARFGVMPLTDDDWSKGKCAFKLLQYMAANLPCVASPVGANCEAIIDGKTGFLAQEIPDWINAMESLLEASDEEINAMGQAGRQHALSNYSTHVIFNRLIQLLDELVDYN